MRWMMPFAAVMSAGCGGDVDAAGTVCPGPRVAQVSFRHVDGGHGCAVTTDGDLICWGSNFDGELGRGTTTQVGYELAAPVAGLGPVQEVEASEGFTCALLVGGAVHCWGRNDLGQLGDDNRPTPSTTPLASPTMTSATSLDSGRWSICATVAGATRPICWGYDMTSTIVNPVVRPIPVLDVRFPIGTTAVALGEQTLCALAGGRITCDGPAGPFGPGGSITDADVLGSGIRHHCAGQPGGAVTCWGQNFDGQLGDGTMIDDLDGVTVVGLTDVVEIVGGWGHTCALRDDGAVWCWGANAEGQLGRGAESDREPVPAQVPGLTDVIALDAGHDSTCAVTASGDLRCWGSLDYGAALRETHLFPTCVDLGP